eukprot:1289268-Prorocentrum_lima.AAC.1
MTGKPVLVRFGNTDNPTEWPAILQQHFSNRLNAAAAQPIFVDKGVYDPEDYPLVDFEELFAMIQTMKNTGAGNDGTTPLMLKCLNGQQVTIPVSYTHLTLPTICSV